MTCSGSPTTSSAAEAPRAAAPAASRDARGGTQAEETAAFEAMLLSTVMQPVSEALGPLGGAISDGFARTLLVDARREAG